MPGLNVLLHVMGGSFLGSAVALLYAAEGTRVVYIGS